MKAQFTIYVDENMDLSFDIEGENMRDLLNQADKFEKIGLEWGEEALDRKPESMKSKAIRKLYPFVIFLEGIAGGVILSPYILKLLGIHP